MLYMSFEDFCRQAKQLPRLSREEEKECAQRMALGDSAARQQLIDSYLPQVAGCLQRLDPTLKTLRTVYAAIATLEKGVDSFNFQQDAEKFSHHLSWRLRQCVTRCIAERY